METRISELLKHISSASSRAEKKALYDKGVEKWPQVEEIFEYTYNKRKMYGIQVDVTNVVGTGCFTLESHWSHVRSTLDLLSARRITGNRARSALNILLKKFDRDDIHIIGCIINRKLNVGMNISFSASFNVALAKKFESNTIDLDASWYISRKLDGVRCLAFIGRNQVTFYSRQEKPIFTLEKLKAPLLSTFPPGYVVDGEICLMKNGKENFSAILSEIKKKDHTIENPHFMIFDALKVEEFNKNVGRCFADRYDSLLSLLNKSGAEHLSAVTQTQYTLADFNRLLLHAKIHKWEGLMLRKNAPYKGGRSADLLKVKKFKDAEYVVKSIIVGNIMTTEPGKGQIMLENVCSSLVIEHKGNDVNVGTGITKEQRIAWAKDPSKILNKVITVKYFEETTNKHGCKSLRFPVLIAVHGEERTL